MLDSETTYLMSINSLTVHLKLGIFKGFELLHHILACKVYI